MKISKLLAVLAAMLALTMTPRLALAGGGGGGGSGGGGPCAAFASGSTLVMLDSCFDSVAHFTSEGDTLTIRNDGQIPHSYTAVDGSFDTGLLNTGESAKIQVGEAGIYQVYCTLHGNGSGHGMAGLLVVGDPSGHALAAAAAAVTAHGSAAGDLSGIAAAISARDQTLEELSGELAGLNESVQAAAAVNRSAMLAPGALGLLGVALGGLALARTRRLDP